MKFPNEIGEVKIVEPRVNAFYYLVLILLVCRYSVFAEIRATATIQPDEITLGKTAQLDVVIDGSATVPAPKIPDVDGLEFLHVGQSTNVQFFNGVMSGGATHIYKIIPRKEGTFTIPPINVTIGRETVKTGALTLKVLKPSSSFLVPPSPAGPGGPSPSGSSSTPSPAPATSSEAAMIRLVYPKRDFYVGELVPISIKACFRQGLRGSLTSFPVFSGTAFTMSKLGNQPERTEEVINGYPYAVFTWQTAIAAVKSGEHPLGAEIEFNVRVSEPMRHRSSPFGGGLFDDPFFDSFFGSVQEKQVKLRTQDATVKVLPLPVEGRPADFSGAIGRFDFTVQSSPSEVVAGDPVNVKMTVIGIGNFDRLQTPEFSKNQGFKTYQPSTRFEPTSEAGNMGQKVFEQVIVPQNTGIKQIPEIRFSFFDPDSRKYVAVASSPIPLKVSPGASTTPPVISQPQVAQGTVASSPVSPGRGMSMAMTDLLPNKLELGRVAFSMTPLIWNPWFWGAQSFPVLFLAIAWGVARRRDRLAHDPDFARAISANRAVRVHLEEMDVSLRKGEPVTFFIAARRALQERLGQRWEVKPETITLSEVGDRLQQDPVLAGHVQKIFETADAMSYSGQAFSSETLHEWKRVVREVLKKMESSK